jgi:putative transcriptional regulator
MARVKKIGHDSWLARKGLHARAEAAELVLPAAVLEMRLALGLLQVEFARAYRMTQRRISDLENGRGNPSSQTLNKIARPFGFALGFVPKPRSAQ